MARLDYTQPPESLAEELREVAGDARTLQEALRRSNGLPDAFPEQQLDELLTGLQALVDGTAEGCREPLTYARARLPQIRREYILTEARSAGTKIEGDQVPPLMRGESIDKALSALMTSVSTALDEYRRLAGETGLDEVDTSSSQTLDQDDADVRAVMNSTTAVETRLDATNEDVAKIVKPGSIKGDELKRQLTDARGLFRLARIELRMPQFMLDWYQKAVDAVKDYPTLLEKTADAIDAKTDLMERIYNNHSDVSQRVDRVWQHFKDGQIKVLASTMRNVTEEIRGFAESKRQAKAKGKGTQSPTTDAAPTPDTPPDDFDLDKVHEDILAGREPKPEWRPWVTELNLRDTDITNLAPLRNLVNLQTLNLIHTQVADIDPIKHLVNLQKLYLSHTQVADIEPIKQIVNLKELDLENTPVADIEPIKQLVNLHILNLLGTPVADIEPIKQLVNLQDLNLLGTPVADIEPIKQLVNLQNLYLSSTNVVDIEPLKQLVNLRNLNLWNTRVADIEPLKQLVKLQNLDLEYTPVADIEPLKHLVNLQYLDLSNTLVADIEPLKQLVNLQTLDLENTQVADIEPIKQLFNLRNLDLENTQVADIEPLKHFINLQSLYLPFTKVADIEPLKHLVNLRVLDIQGTRVNDLSPLKNLQNLEHVYVERGRVGVLARSLGRRGVVKLRP